MYFSSSLQSPTPTISDDDHLSVSSSSAQLKEQLDQLEFDKDEMAANYSELEAKYDTLQAKYNDMKVDLMSMYVVCKVISVFLFRMNTRMLVKNINTCRSYMSNPNTN